MIRALAIQMERMKIDYKNRDSQIQKKPNNNKNNRQKLDMKQILLHFKKIQVSLHAIEKIKNENIKKVEIK